MRWIWRDYEKLSTFYKQKNWVINNSEEESIFEFVKKSRNIDSSFLNLWRGKIKGISFSPTPDTPPAGSDTSPEISYRRRWHFHIRLAGQFRLPEVLSVSAGWRQSAVSAPGSIEYKSYRYISWEDAWHSLDWYGKSQRQIPVYMFWNSVPYNAA